MKHEGCQGWGLPLSCKMSVLFLSVFQIFLFFLFVLSFSLRPICFSCVTF